MPFQSTFYHHNFTTRTSISLLSSLPEFSSHFISLWRSWCCFHEISRDFSTLKRYSKNIFLLVKKVSCWFLEIYTSLTLITWTEPPNTRNFMTSSENWFYIVWQSISGHARRLQPQICGWIIDKHKNMTEPSQISLLCYSPIHFFFA